MRRSRVETAPFAGKVRVGQPLRAAVWLYRRNSQPKSTSIFHTFTILVRRPVHSRLACPAYPALEPRLRHPQVPRDRIDMHGHDGGDFFQGHATEEMHLHNPD